MYKYQIDCEVAMNELLNHLQDTEPVFNRADVFDAFEEAGEDYLPHLMSALKHNACATIEELLDKAVACDFLIEYKGEYIAIDWTDNELEMLNKLDKHKWLAPVYEYLGISYTVVIKTTGYHHIRTKTHETIARLKASGKVIAHLENVMEKGQTNSTLEFRIETKF